MPKRVVPQSFVAGRRFVLDGVAYEFGATVPNSVVIAQRHLNRLIAGGYLVPETDQYGRTTAAVGKRRRPSWLTSAERKKIVVGP